MDAQALAALPYSGVVYAPYIGSAFQYETIEALAAEDNSSKKVERIKIPEE